MTPLEASARHALVTRLGAEATAVGRAPGRVELLGNHTDYNGGLVMAAAIDRFTAVAATPAPPGTARAVSAHFGGLESFDPRAPEPGAEGSWGRYVRGVVWALGQDHGSPARGFDAAIAGDVPLGAGLSSSASLQAALALALLRLGLVPGQGADLDDPARLRLAQTLRRSENEFVGVAAGLLDQFAVLFGRAGHVLTLDCRSLAYERVPLGRPAPAIVVCDSKTSRRLADGQYNRRREECERVVAFFRARRGGEAVRWLRDLTPDDLGAAWDELDPVGRLRARHVLSENERVRLGAEALKAGDLAAFGGLMSGSHASSRDDFGNSSPALDALVEAAEGAPGFLGGKLSGAGWAGCTVNLVAADRVGEFGEAVRSSYARATGVTPEVHACRAADGASAETVTIA